MMSEPIRLFTAGEVSKLLGVRRNWIHNRVKNGTAPMPEFAAKLNGAEPVALWSENGLRRWQMFHASSGSIPAFSGRYTCYSDHRAVNRFAGVEVTWKLWWRNVWDGGTEWWFSTPDGWYTSIDDGSTWRREDRVLRPDDYHYYCVNINDNVKPTSTVAAVLRSITALRQRLEGSSDG